MINNQKNGNQKWSAHRVKALRTRSGLSQQKFAERLGVAINTVARWETGMSIPHERWTVPLLESLDRDLAREGK